MPLLADLYRQTSVIFDPGCSSKKGRRNLLLSQNLQQLLYLFLLLVRSTQFKSIGNLLFPGFHRTDGEFLPVDAGTCRDYLFSYIYPVKNGQPGDQHKRKDHHAPHSFLHIFAPVPPVFSLYYMDVEGVV